MDRTIAAAGNRGAVGRTGRYRHVVFADAIDGAQRALNLAPVPPDETDAAIDVDESAFLTWLFQRSGLDARNYRAETLARRLPACFRKLRVANIAQARATLQQQQRVNDALNSILIGVTAFFRDPSVFEELAQKILPSLLTGEKRRQGSPLRVWSVGCSNGAELYSVAMLLAELGAAQGIPLPEVELLGTDCRVEATRFAAEGVYDSQALEGVSRDRLTRHFDPEPPTADSRSSGQRKRIAPSLRAMTRWRTADVMSTAEPGPWDLILCRNTAMYLKSSAAAALWNQLSNALNQGGYLVLGRAERPGGADGLTCTGQYLYRRTG
jgi:chemotaxis protein methyltransferase CheR